MLAARGLLATAPVPLMRGRAYLEFMLLTAALFIGATVLTKLGFATGPLQAPLRMMTLAVENNLGAWFSSMLLWLVALHAYDGYARHRRSAPRIARAWAVIAAILAFLSFDEMSSTHERLMEMAEATGIGAWSPILILGGVIGATVVRALWTLWTGGPDHRRSAIWLIAGFGLLGTIVLQEYADLQVAWTSLWAQAIRVALEEGTELVGMIVLLAVTMRNSAPFRADGGPAFAALDELRTPLLMAGLIAAPVLAIVTGLVDADRRGRPADWLAAAAFGMAALWLLRPWILGERPARRVGWTVWLQAGLCLMASAASVRWIAGIEITILGTAIATRLAVVLPLCLAIALVLPRPALPAGLVLGLALFAPMATPLGWPVYLLAQLAGLATWAGVARAAGSAAASAVAVPGDRPPQDL